MHSINSITSPSEKTPQKISSPGRVGDALDIEGVQVILVLAQKLDVLKALVTDQNVLANIENMVRLEIRLFLLEQFNPRVDAFIQTNSLQQKMKKSDPAVINALAFFGHLVVNIIVLEHGRLPVRIILALKPFLISALLK